MATLHIEHAITDLPTWMMAFQSFAEKRRSAGVIAHRVHQPVDDDQYIYVQLDFGDTESAEKFLQFLRSVVWASPEASPALAGSPTGRVLVEVTSGQS